MPRKRPLAIKEHALAQVELFTIGLYVRWARLLARMAMPPYAVRDTHFQLPRRLQRGRGLVVLVTGNQSGAALGNAITCAKFLG